MNLSGRESRKNKLLSLFSTLIVILFLSVSGSGEPRQKLERLMQVSHRIRVNLSGYGSRETNLSKLINTLFVISFSLYMKYLKLHM